jgi:hypothetical protein
VRIKPNGERFVKVKKRNHAIVRFLCFRMAAAVSDWNVVVAVGMRKSATKRSHCTYTSDD